MIESRKADRHVFKVQRLAKIGYIDAVLKKHIRCSIGKSKKRECVFIYPTEKIQRRDGGASGDSTLSGIFTV